MKFAFIARHRDVYPVRLLCQVLAVSRAGFYAAQRRPASRRWRANQRLRLEIRAAHAASRQRYGAPKIYHELRARGIACGRHRVARLMRADRLRAKRVRAFRVTTQSRHAWPIAANRLDRRFDVATYAARDRVWAADITYIATPAGWLYLAVLLDVASRRVVGWSLAPHLDTRLTLGALDRAFTLRRPPPGILHHSDRGAQYASAEYQAVLAAHGAICSMSRARDCWDNAVAESFFATLKTELVHAAHWPTREAACRDITEFIDWYNTTRRHASLGYRSPSQYESEVLYAA